MATVHPIRPGWYPDPQGGPKRKYWDGHEWRTAPRSPKLERRREWAEQQRTAISNEEICTRCGRPNPESADGGLPNEWEALTDADGKVLGVICEDCVTPEEQQALDDDAMALLDELGESVICYHTTDAANEILRDGFRDATGSYGMVNFELTGVWLGNSPMDINEGATGDQVLRVEFSDDVDLSEFELIEEHKPYREWCVPAALINTRATVTLMADESE